MNGRAPRLRRGLLILAGLTGLTLIGVLALGGPRDGLPLDPRSTSATGTRALTEVLEAVGADVTVTAEPRPADDVVLVLVDLFDEQARADLVAVLEGGATVVLADPGSPLAPEVIGRTGLGLLEVTLTRSCDAAAFVDVERVAPGDAAIFDAGEASLACFPRGTGAWLVAERRGDGTLVSVGGPRWLTNAGLAEADNALLAAALLVPHEGAAVTVVPPRLRAAEEGATSPFELVPAWVWAALAQLGLAGLALVWWRARRLGPPAVEEQPVSLPGSELTLALGELYARRGDAAHAARAVREAARADVAGRLGLDRHATAAQVAAAAARMGVAEADLALALRDPLPTDDAGLLALARAVETVAAALVDAPGATAPGATAPGATVPADAGTATPPRTTHPSRLT